MRKQKGFSLIELLIVVAIILIIAAIAIPNLLKSRVAANESSAVGSIRTIASMQVQYRINHTDPPTYAPTLADLGPAGSNLIDGALASGVKSGYNFTVDNAAAETYQASGWPVSAGNSGNRAFCVDQSAVIHTDGTLEAPVAASAGCIATLGTANQTLGK